MIRILSFFFYLLSFFTIFPSFGDLQSSCYLSLNMLSEEEYKNYLDQSTDLLDKIEKLKSDYHASIESVGMLEFYNDPNTISLLSNHLILAEEQNSPHIDFFKSEFLFLKGTTLNELLLYQEAISVLTEAIAYNPSNIEAFIERAAAYFEINQLPLALQDYESAKRIPIPPFLNANYFAIQAEFYIPKNKIDFSNGLILGIVSGASLATQEFFPSLFGSLRGLLNGLWAFACSPAEISQELVVAAYALGDFIKSHSTTECLQCVIPELKELSSSWDDLTDHLKGKKIGFIIGKYGLDIFAPIGVLKGIDKVKALRRANTMLTLEICQQSKIKQLKILEESSKHATLRTSFISEAVENGKILLKNSNTKCHIMQKKHAWDKIFNLTGDIEIDIKKLIIILEEHGINAPSNLIGKPELFPIASPKIKKSIFEKKINNHIIHAEFETYLETGVTFLQDAWVVTK